MIPIVPASGRRDAFASGKLGFDGEIPFIEKPCDLRGALAGIHSATESDDEILLLDVDGFSSGFMNGDVVKSIRLKGRDLILVTHIENIDDIISALTGSFSFVGIPLHTLDDEDALLDGIGMSDSIIPTAFASEGREIGSGESIDRVGRRMEILGFERMLVIDIDRTIAESVRLHPSTYSTI